MNSRKIALKLYAKPGTLPPSHRFVEVFHDWIKDSVLAPETLVDVTDYGHVHHGPSVLLVGHESDFSIDFSEGRPGLAYVRKRAPDEPAKRLDDSLRRILKVAALLEADARLAPLAFAADEITLKVLDRLAVPNDETSFSAHLSPIVSGFEAVFGKGIEVVREGRDPREPFSVRVRARPAGGAAELSKRWG